MFKEISDFVFNVWLKRLVKSNIAKIIFIYRIKVVVNVNRNLYNTKKNSVQINKKKHAS